MEIRSFEMTCTKDLEEHLARKGELIGFGEMLDLLQHVNVNMVLTGINRVQSTEICNMRDSYVQQSQRYVRMGADAYINPLDEYQGIYDADDREEIAKVIESCFDLYSRMTVIKDGVTGRTTSKDYVHGIPIEDGRYILPLATKTAISISMPADRLMLMLADIEPTTAVVYGKHQFVGMPKVYAEILRHLPDEIVGRIATIDYHLDKGQGSTYHTNEFYDKMLQDLTWDKNLKFIGSFKSPEKIVATGALVSTKDDAFAAVDKLNGLDDMCDLIKRVSCPPPVGYKHVSILEQQRTTFGIMLSLTAYHQMIRHRLPAMYTESLEDVVYAGMIQDGRSFIIPETIRNSVFLDEYVQLATKMRDLRNYIGGKYGVVTAKPLLLNCDGIKFIQSTNARIDIEMLTERTCNNAQWEIRKLAQEKVRILNKISPTIYGSALPNCLKGGCTEGKLSCGHPPKF